MRTILLSLLLTFGVFCGDTIYIDCVQCGSVACLTFGGGPLVGDQMQTNESSCADVGTFPIITQFACSTSACDSGCQILISGTTQLPAAVCSDSLEGENIINSYNQLYSTQIGANANSAQYDWCNCGGGLSGGAIAGIIVGSIAGVILIGGVAYCLWKRKKQFGNFAKYSQ
jgi:hypothetical protein